MYVGSVQEVSCLMFYNRMFDAAMKFQPDGGNGGDGGDVVLRASRECVRVCVSLSLFFCSNTHVLIAGLRAWLVCRSF